MNDTQGLSGKWFALALLTFSGTFVTAMPVSCMPSLFKEISVDLGLDLVQIGLVWGISSMAGIFVSIPSGVLSDRFRAKQFLIVLCLLVGITGALRGLAISFVTLMLTVFLNGLVRMMAPVVIIKAVGVWFRGPRLGTAMGISAMGMGLGLFLGPLISASVLSPLLGGWRHVLYFYGLLTLLCGVAWMFLKEESVLNDTPARTISMDYLRRSLLYLLRNRTLWLLSLALLLRVGGIMGLTGYLPLYLRGQGWAPAAADAALAVFYAVSAGLVVPISVISDRIGSRKAILLTSAALTTIAMGLLPLVDGGGVVWVLVVLAGMLMDGFMAINVTMLLETKGIGVEYAGIAIGIIFSISPLGNLIAPPLGNSFAKFGAGVPFFFWAGFSLMSVIILLMLHETAKRKPRAGRTELAAH